MNGLFIYPLQSLLCSALFTAYYYLFLRNKRLHTFNRWYILSAFVLSLVLPLLRLSLPGISLPPDAPVYHLLDVAASGMEEETMINNTTPSYSWPSLAALLYAAGTLLMAILLLAKFVWLYRVYRKGTSVLQNGYTLVYSSDSRAPFSFLHLLFWKNGSDLHSEEGQRILTHELVHIRQQHTLDKLFSQTVLVFCWYNPFFWLLQQEQALVHEFMADEGAIENRDTDLFARMLLQEYYGNSYPDITLPFFNSSTKRRLLMLHQSNTPRFAVVRRLMALPLLGTALLLFSFRPGEAVLTPARHTVNLALDAGHGGTDPGASGLNGTKEKDLTLKITQRLAQMAPAYNVKIIPLRPDDANVSLPERTAKANALAADLLLSVHLNAATQQSNTPPAKGFDIVLMKDNRQYAESRQLASAMAAQLAQLQIPTQLLDRRLALLRSASMPAILVECGYMEKAEDVQRITDPAQLDKLCAAILEAVVAYSNNKS